MRYPIAFAIGLSAFSLIITVVKAADEQIPFTGVENLKKPQHLYGFWDSPVTSEWIGNRSNTVEDVFVDKVTKRIYYIERQAGEGGRNIIKEYITNEPVFDGPYDARTRVHEHGGGQSFAYNGSVYFSNYPDDMLYVVKPGEKTPVLLTSEQNIRNSPRRLYADFDVHPVHPRIVVGVVEVHGETVKNFITTIDMETGKESGTGFVLSDKRNPQALFQCPEFLTDFVDNPRFSPDGRHLVFRTWSHPHTSWEASELWVGEVKIQYQGSLEPPHITVINPKRIAGSRSEYSVGEPVWFNSSTLVFTSDVDGYNAPWIYDLAEDKAKALSIWYPHEEDFSEPSFRLGTSTVAVVDEKSVVYTTYRRGRTYFALFNMTTGAMQVGFTMGLAYATRLRSVSPGSFAFVATWDTELAVPISVNLYWESPFPHDPEMLLLSWRLKGPDHLAALLRHHNMCPGPFRPRSDPPSFISCPALEGDIRRTYTPHAERAFVDPDTGDTVLATYYPPTNPNYAGGLLEELPPVIVNVHGGPTAFSHHGLNWEVQYFTSRGFAWVDVNCAGSTRYGRAYRERLLGQWGVVDVRDALTAVREYGALGMLDPSRAMIRGGGLTVLSALATAPDAFLAGTSIAGVSDLLALQSKLPKIESRHLLKYVGGTPGGDPELWWDRSPISRAGKIQAPLLILHGEDDPVVLVEQATKMFEAVRESGGRAELHIFEGEGHEWRQATSVTKALELELELYQTALNGTI